MNNDNIFSNTSTEQITFGPESASGVRSFMASVFSYMTTALIISGVLAWWFGHDLELMSYLFNPATGKMNILGWVVMLAPLGFVFAMNGLINRLSSTMLLLLFIAYSAVTGISLSFIFVAFTGTSIFTVFLMAAGVFAVMAVAGYTTKTDLTKLGSILMLGVIALVIGSVINMFIGSSGFDFLLSLIGVVIFTGLTAYKMQQLKQLAQSVVSGTEAAQKMAIMGALGLYITFINLFLTLLRLFGGRRD